MDSTCFCIGQVPLFFVDNRLIERTRGDQAMAQTCAAGEGVADPVGPATSTR